MEIIPVIYIRNGRSVTFYKGDSNQSKIYPRSPLNYAKYFASVGAKYVHIIDKDGLANWEMIKEIATQTPIKVQLAAKIRTLEQVELCLNQGIQRVVIGVAGNKIIKDAVNLFGSDRIFAGIKGKDRKVISGTNIKADLEVSDYAQTLAKLGVQNVLYHDLLSEGTMIHPNYDELERLVNLTNLNPYISGGISDIKHLKLLEKEGAKGALIGKAIYENELNLAEILS